MRDWKTASGDLVILEELDRAERGLVAVKLGLTYEALNQHIHRIKDRYRRYNWYIHEVNKLITSSKTVCDLFMEVKANE